ncbi:MAG TPA: ribosome biogenesis GTP-binding protein YihA/YsxC [Clostridia bacterium]|nr:ribosome biogenesis GTP-binding protein YihA/YsxC [Clostridia bacterium]
MSAEKDLFKIKQAEFLTSVGIASEGYPALLDAEIAIVGKSNVGKSTLINTLCNNKKLAKTSQSPGKTRLLNFFVIIKSFYLVDLPGYGYAKASKATQESWGQLVETYLNSGRVTHMLILLDIRHEPTAQDRQLFQWLLHAGIPFTIVATKADKLARSKQQKAANTAAKLLGAPPAAFLYSSRENIGNTELLEHIGRIVSDVSLSH